MTRPAVLDWVAVALTGVTAMLAALVELFIVPLYSGATLIPLAAVLAVATNVLLPRLGRAIAASTLAALVPLIGWLLVVVAVGVMTRPEGDVVLPGGGNVQWAGLGVIFGGLVAGIATVVLTMPPPAPRGPNRQP